MTTDQTTRDDFREHVRTLHGVREHLEDYRSELTRKQQALTEAQISDGLDMEIESKLTSVGEAISGIEQAISQIQDLYY